MKLPSIDKGKHACQRVFPALFALFALAGASPPASQKPKITRRSIAGRCGQFCRSRNVSRQGKARREYCRIVKGLDAVWAHFCPSKPCLPSSIDGMVRDRGRGPARFFCKKRENPLTFPALLYIVYLLSFDGKSGAGTGAVRLRRGRAIL